MKQEETIAGNKLIAEFLYPNAKRDFDAIPEDGEVDKSFFQIGKMMLVSGNYDQLKYDKDWNDLMEVVEKIESKGFDVQISNLYCRITDYGQTDFEIESGEAFNKIEAVWQSVIEFIQWYNKHKGELNHE